ncbi:MAG: hydantoinase B/oxoprolinase family protein, partial [Syntrophales bacterium]|nr:hydantoinase B/oxoprolinase family protein [Syntrophales bacterium]
MSKTIKKDIDPITYEILRHRLFSILQEGRYAMARVSGSPVATEAKETMTAIYDADGEIILTAAGVFLHIIGVNDEIKYIIENYKDEPGIYDGDIFFFNDPYLGGIHTNDIASIMPIFHKGELIAWASGLVHTAETGAIQPGGMPGDATEVYHEGLSVPGLKVVEKGKLRKDFIRFLERATRSPAMIVLDTKARNASCYAIKKGFIELVERYGKDTVLAMCDRLVQESEILARRKLEKLPDGTWRQEVFADHDGKKYTRMRIRCTMTKKGDHITFDFE